MLMISGERDDCCSLAILADSLSAGQQLATPHLVAMGGQAHDRTRRPALWVRI